MYPGCSRTARGSASPALKQRHDVPLKLKRPFAAHASPVNDHHSPVPIQPPSLELSTLFPTSSAQTRCGSISLCRPHKHREKKPGSAIQVGRVQPSAALMDEAVTAASGLSPCMLRPRWASDKRSWLPVCGQSPVQAPAAMGGNGEKGTDGGTGVLDGKADEAFFPTTVSPSAHDGSLPQQQGSEKVKEAVGPTTVSPFAQNGALPLPWQKGSDKVEEVVAFAAVLPERLNDILSRAPPRSGPDWARQDGNRGENGEEQLLGDAGKLLLDGQEGNQLVEVVSPAVAVMDSYDIVGASSVHNSDKEACLLAAEEQGHVGISVVWHEEVTTDGDAVEMGNRTGGSELQREENEISGSRRKRLLKSDANPPPKKWAVSPVSEPRAVVDDKMKILRAPLNDPIDVKTKGNVLESGKMNAAMLGNGDASSRGRVQSKTLSAKSEMMCSNMNIKQKKFACKLNGDGISNDNLHRSAGESKLGKHVATNQVEDSYVNLVADQVIIALMAPGKCPWTRGRKSTASASKSLVPRNKIKGKYASPKELLTGQAVSRELINDETVEDNDDTNLEEDDNSGELDVYGEKREIFVTPSVPSGPHHKQPGDHMDARSKVRKLLQLYQATYRKLTQIEEQGIHKVGSIYLEAAKAVQKDPIYKKIGAIVGNIPGVEVGDEFHFRIELSIVGLHRQYQGGIDISKVNGVPVAISVVASGGYPDELSSSGELIYTGSGGKAGGNKDGGDQKLERGNLALKNCIGTKTPVRVIHGFKGRSRSEVGKQTSTFTYDGLYEVVECWQEGPKGGMVFKFKLQRIAGQPELALHAVKATRKSKVREGLCLPDISQGSERIAICVINTIDDMRLPPFKYITNVIYPTWYEKEPQKGCDCTNGCSDSIRCACAVKNGGEIPFNFDCAIVEAKRLIYECGPWCRCPPTCYNRVSQHGVKIPLEIFKTGKTGWGVRSLSSISSGSFICEYTGELLDGNEAENRQNDEYLFDIGSNYNDDELWKGLQPVVDVESSTSSSRTMKGFTIDAAECGNVGRFINHSCSPNLYAQNVLWDHDDMRMPRVMFFAVENIPPLQELTYHYNYEVGSVHDENGNEKVKHCYCGASNCSGRLY